MDRAIYFAQPTIDYSSQANENKILGAQGTQAHTRERKTFLADVQWFGSVPPASATNGSVTCWRTLKPRKSRHHSPTFPLGPQHRQCMAGAIFSVLPPWPQHGHRLVGSEFSILPAWKLHTDIAWWGLPQKADSPGEGS